MYPIASMAQLFLKAFHPIRTAVFLDRPNRFIAHARLRDGTRVRAFMPNPGRMWELLMPGVKLWLGDSGADTTRKTRYTVLAVERNGAPVFLHTHVNNDVARTLIETQRVPGLEGAEIVRPEVTVGHSRFDFLLRHGRRDVYLEVKSCTLFGNRVAMFPDAITERGRRHLEELAALRSRATRTVVLFVIHSSQVQWFMPDYHTDLEFARTLMDVRKRVDVIPLCVSWSPRLQLNDSAHLAEIPWRYVRKEARDSGDYMAVYRMGKRGDWQIAADSAPSDLSTTLRRCKPKHVTEWYPIPIRSATSRIEEIRLDLDELFGPEHTSKKHPLHMPAFHSLIERYRMREPR